MTQEMPSLEAREKTAALLAGLWKRNLPLVESRLGLLERAREQALAGALTEELRTEAAEIAHKFAGSLGMFGLAAGTEIARELELALEPAADNAAEATAAGAARIASLVEQLRSVLFPET